jgi:hypothetical protein
MHKGRHRLGHCELGIGAAIALGYKLLLRYDDPVTDKTEKATRIFLCFYQLLIYSDACGGLKV